MVDASSVTHNLPHLTTSFVGRQPEIAEIANLLDNPTCHLLTLAGSGGAGKTRLAIEVARQKQLQFAQGVWFVPLAPLTSADQIPAAIANGLHIQTGGGAALKDEVLNFLRDKQLLLVLDNFEHVLPGAELVGEILAATSQVKVLVTSRSILNMQAEWVHPVQGMRYPNDPSENLETFSAVRLFAERAQRVRPDFALSKSGNCVVRICQLVEGMPLALELAAAWMKTIPCELIAEQIQRDLNFLASDRRDVPERHQSIRAVFDHSWKLLTADEQQVFQRFSVFRGGCTLDAAAAVTEATLAMMNSLVERSLLTLELSGRYGLHELLRQYGEEKLINSGELDAAHAAHSAYYCNFMGQLEVDIKGGRQVEALVVLEPDVENIRAAWLKASEQRDFTSIDHALVVLDFLFSTGNRMPEHSIMLEHAYQKLMPVADEPPQRAWRRLLARPNDIPSQEDRRARCKQAVALARQYGDQAEIGVCLLWLGEVTNGIGPSKEALPYLEEALGLLRAQGDHYFAGRTLNELGRCYIFMGEPQKAIPYIQEAFRLRRDRNDRVGMAWCLFDMGDAHFDLGQIQDGESYLIEALKYFSEVRSLVGLNSAYQTLITQWVFSGALEKAQEWTEAHLEVCKAYHTDLTVNSRVRLGLLAAVTGDHERCHSLLKSGTEFSKDYFFPHLALAIAAFGIAEHDDARLRLQVLIESSDLSYSRSPIEFQLHILPIAAILLADEGQDEWAVEMLGLAFNHPPYLTGWMKCWTPLTKLHDQLETKLGAERFSVAWERGEKLDIDDAIAALRSRFLVDNDAQQEANQVLNDPLTVRELEVLNLIYAGSSNREIAAHFVVAESTIKRHINHIYNKLNIESRAEAIERARELGLLR